MTTLVSLDPGLRHAGLAVFRDGVLVHAALVESPEKKARGAAAWAAMADSVNEVMSYLQDGVSLDPRDRGPLWGIDRPDVLVFEKPQVYTQGKQKGDPNDLIELAGVDGAILGRLCPEKAVSYLPREWKSTTPKPIHNRRIESCLTPAELETFQKCPPHLRHNIVDSVGLGLFHLKRLDRMTGRL